MPVIDMYNSCNTLKKCNVMLVSDRLKRKLSLCKVKSYLVTRKYVFFFYFFFYLGQFLWDMFFFAGFSLSLAFSGVVKCWGKDQKHPVAELVPLSKCTTRRLSLFFFICILFSQCYKSSERRNKLKTSLCLVLIALILVFENDIFLWQKTMLYAI